jgi:hypothetical protein
MARHDALPTEIWNAIFAQMGMKDRMSAVATCCHLRAFRAAAWARITLVGSDFLSILQKLRRLADALEADASLQPLVRDMIIGRLMAWESRHVYWPPPDPYLLPYEVDAVVAGVLRLAPKLECFVIGAPEEEGPNFELTLQALCKLPSLKTLALVNVEQHVLDPKYCLGPRVLERLIICWGGKMDYCRYLGDQKRLKSVVLTLDPVVSLSLDIATSWVAVEELSVSFGTAQRDPENFHRWPLIVTKGLVITYLANRCALLG